MLLLNTMVNKSAVTLDQVFNVTSVALVGISAENPFTFAKLAMTALTESGFPAVYPVNPRVTEIAGLPCYPTVSSVPNPVDHVVVCIPAARVLDLLDDCARKGVKSVHFFTAGFSESGEQEGAELEKAMLKKAREGGFRIIGPNCTGLYVPKMRFTTATRLPMEPGSIAFMSQSGGHSQDMPLHAGPRGIRFSKVMSYGNAIDIDECELLEYFTDDPETKIIAAYIEGVRNGTRFRDVLQKAAEKKPVVIYKGGKSEAGLRAAMGHTASMTSSVEVFRTLCRQVNTIQVNDIHEMIDALVALSYAVPYPVGRNMAVLGVGGGPTVEASDSVEQVGLKLPPFSSTVNAELRNYLPGAGAIFANPLDATNMMFPDIFYKALKIVGQDSGIDMLMYHMGFHPVTRWGGGLFAGDMFLKQGTEAFAKAAAELHKPVVLALGPVSDLMSMQEFMEVQESFVKAGLPVFHSIEKATLAMSRLVEWQRGRIRH
ncbi:MAG: CoA-binding protein [Dehalococcoidia bacterium]|nr:CoA-binding protein [Dehalococcoidia bacterium]